MVDSHLGERNAEATELGNLIFETTRGNALFVTEALHNLDERLDTTGDGEKIVTLFFAKPTDTYRPEPALPRSQRVQEIIMERVDRLPTEARAILNLCAVIGRDFSLDLLESAASLDPLGGLETLLERKFLIERPDERLDFTHHLVRQTVYEGLSILQRRRLHLSVAEALVDLGQAANNPGEVAFHYRHAGTSHRLLAARVWRSGRRAPLAELWLSPGRRHLRPHAGVARHAAGQRRRISHAARCKGAASHPRACSIRKGSRAPTAACKTGRAAIATARCSLPRTAALPRCWACWASRPRATQCSTNCWTPSRRERMRLRRRVLFDLLERRRLIYNPGHSPR